MKPVDEVRNRSGRGGISPQVIAVILLGLSVSMLLSAYRSIGREFSGVIVGKTVDSGMTGYFNLTLAAIAAESVASEPMVSRVLSGEIPSRRVGVSRMVFDGSQLMQRISKEPFSPFIFVDGERHFDLGLQWFLWGCLGIILAIFAYRQGVTSEGELRSEQ